MDVNGRLPIERSLSPIGLTPIIEPAWARVDETSGERVTKYNVKSRPSAGLGDFSKAEETSKNFDLMP
jgi:hypothetical protein